MSAEEIRTQFEADGFYINRERRLSEAVVRKGREGMRAVRKGAYDTGRGPEGSPWKPGDSENVLCKIEMPQMASRDVFDLVSDPLIGQFAAEATGGNWIQAWWVQLLYKPVTPPNVKLGTNVGWHQDRSYWGAWEEGSELLTAWVALSDVTMDAGPMTFVRGSHKWGFRPGSDFHGQDLEGIKAKIGIPAGEKWDEVPATMSSGAFSLHDELTWHGSGPNRSSGPRMGFAIHLRTEKSRPVADKRAGLTQWIDEPSACPIIYGRA